MLNKVDEEALQLQVAAMTELHNYQHFKLKEIEFCSEIRYVLAKPNIHSDDLDYFLIDKNCDILDAEYTIFDRVYPCDNCLNWTYLVHTQRAYTIDNQGSKYIIIKRVCHNCYDELFKEYKKSKEYINYSNNYKTHIDHMRKYIESENKKKQYLHDYIEVEYFGEKRIVLKVTCYGRDLSFYHLISKDYTFLRLETCFNEKVDIIQICPKCKTPTLTSDTILNHCYKCYPYALEKLRSTFRSSIGFSYDKRKFRDFTLTREERKKADVGWSYVSWVQMQVNHDIGYCCVLTGIEESTYIVWDHFIALSTGHVGIIKGNYVPMDYRLNRDKLDQNPFEWIKKRPDIDREKFNELVRYLAGCFDLKVNQYRAFVYWCYKNKRGINEILREYTKSSLDLWKESRQKTNSNAKAKE
jgi:hypothetical protein